MKRTELEAIIKEAVREELQRTTKAWLKTYVPAVVGQVVTELVEAKVQRLLESNRPRKAPITEGILLEDEEWPTLGKKPLTTRDAPSLNRDKLASLMGYGDVKPANNMVTTIVTDAGVEIPVPPEKIPEDLVVNLNKNYSGFLKKMGGVTARTRSGQ